ncbi:MAG: signal peptidase I [Muribaculaceae bacterium]|nr:signal peptidase I [Muribaculaceae bacterium]
MFTIIIYLLVVVFGIICSWKIFSKAGREGWESLIPLWNIIVMFKIAKLSPWLILTLLIPIVNFIILIYLYIKLAKAFDKGVGFGLGLCFLSIIFFPILAFGDAKYNFDED